MKKVSYILSLMLVLSIALSSVLYAQDQPKKKWSPVAKGAVIGAGTGAAAGAIINKKNRVAGGIVGGVVGGAVGAGVGKVIDNKQKKKAAEEQARMDQLNQVAAANEPAPVPTYSTNSARSYAAAPAKKSHTVKRTTTNHVVAAEEPAAVQPAYLMNGWIPNDGAADPSVAYANSEYKRKSW